MPYGEKNREYHRAYYHAHKALLDARSYAWAAAHKDVINARANAVYADRKARGMCVQCGKVPAAAGRVRCEACLRDASARTTRYAVRKAGKERKDDGK